MLLLLLLLLPATLRSEVRQLRVGIRDLPPLATFDTDGKAAGLFVDLLDYVAQQEHWQVRYIPVGQQEALEQLEGGEIDLLLPLAYTDERAARVAFANEFVLLDWGSVISQPEQHIASILDLHGAVIAMVRGSVFATALKEHLRQFHVDAEFVEFDSYQELCAAVETGRCNAGVCGNITGLNLQGGYRVKRTPIVFSPVHTTFAAPAGRRDEVLARLDTHLARLKADSDSFLFQRQAYWLHPHSQADHHAFYYLLGALAAGLLLLGYCSVYWRRQVKAKNADLLSMDSRLQEKDALLQAVIAGSNDAIFIKDESGRYLMVNPAVETLLQQPGNAILGQTDAELFSPQQASRLRDQDRQVLEDNVGLTVEEILSTPSGQRTFLTTKGPLRNAAGGLIGIFGISRDVTASKETEQILRDNEEKLRQLNQQFQTLLDGIPNHLMLISADWSVRWMNRAARRYVGIADCDADNQLCHRLWQGAAEPCPGCPLQACLVSGEPQEIVQRVKDRVFGVKVFPLKDEQGAVTDVIKLAIDITEKVRLREDADRKNRLSAVGELSAGIAHEINNPTGLILSNLTTFGEALDDIAPLLDEHYRVHGDFPLGGVRFSRMRQQLPAMLVETVEAARRISQIVQDLKDFTHGGNSLVKADFYLDAAVDRAIRLTGNSLRQATANFSVEQAAQKIVIHGSSRQVEQVLVNLLSNACQALNDRRCAIVLTTRFDVERQLALVMVRDEGIGIPEENLSKLATPFFTTRLAQGGTGLGLSVSFGIVKEHNGTMQFVSELGKGTTVTVALPAQVVELSS